MADGCEVYFFSLFQSILCRGAFVLLSLFLSSSLAFPHISLSISVGLLST